VPLAVTPSAARSAGGAEATPRPALDPELLDRALDIIADNYVDAGALSTENLTRGAIRGIVEALGDEGHTAYLNPEEVQAERDALDGRVRGIGVFIDQRSGLPRVISVVSGSPADRAGLQEDDLIVSVDGERVERMPPGELVSRVTGEAGTSVRLGIERPGRSDPLEVSIVRAVVEVRPVDWAFAPGSDVAVVRLIQFSAGAAAELRSAVREAQEAGATGIVLDLRGNPGGLVDEAVSTVGAFMADGIVFRQRDRDGPVTDVPVRGDLVAPDIPLVVLVDYGSASAAEIVAAALRDGGRAVLLGEQTYGTGTVLNTFGLPDGSAIRLGVLEWLTPTGEHIFRVGVAPDEVVERRPGGAALEPGDLVGMTAADLGASGDEQLRRALEVLDG
jgi:carboxyl-terminal processing protease